MPKLNTYHILKTTIIQIVIKHFVIIILFQFQQQNQKMQSDILLSILKVVFMIAFFLIVTVVGSLPIRSKNFKNRPMLRQLGTAFAGALFLNVALLHILPESADTIEEHMKDGDQDKQVFPLAYLFMLGGFLITVFFTKVFATHSHKDDHEAKKSSTLDSADDVEQDFSTQLVKKKGNISLSIINEAYILTIAMYFHTIFEGIAIGVQTSVTGFLSTAVAIAFHKWADALSMGIHYKSKAINKKTSFVLIIGQAILNVAAIGVGWLISSKGELVQAIFLSISAGTFLAISTMQMLSQAFHHRHYIWIKYCLLIFATAFVSAIWFVENMIFNEENLQKLGF